MSEPWDVGAPAPVEQHDRVRESGSVDLDCEGRTSLHYAAADDDESVVGELISAGVDPTLPDRGGWTPLHFAAQADAAEVARLLIRAGADPNARDTHGNSPLWVAVFNARNGGQIIPVLRESGADAHTVNNAGRSPLDLARTIANYDVARFFDDIG